MSKNLRSSEAPAPFKARTGRPIALAVALSFRPRRATPVVAALALAACTGASAGATLFDQRNVAWVRAAFLLRDRSWVDHARLGDVTLVRGLGRRTDALEQLFWNRSVTSMVALPGTRPADWFDARELRVDERGFLFAAGRRLEGPLLVDEYGAVVRMRDARRVASSQTYRLWRPAGTPRLASAVLGYYDDGWLAAEGTLHVWPAATGSGRIEFTVRAADPVGRVDLTVVTTTGQRARLHVRRGTARVVGLPVCGRAPWHAAFIASKRIFLRAVRSACAPTLRPGGRTRPPAREVARRPRPRLH